MSEDEERKGLYPSQERLSVIPGFNGLIDFALGQLSRLDEVKELINSDEYKDRETEVMAAIREQAENVYQSRGVVADPDLDLSPDSMATLAISIAGQSRA